MGKAALLLLLGLLQLNTVIAQFDNPMPAPLHVSSNGHYLQYQDGKPFFWLGDTGWELFHRLTKEEILKYLNNRHDKGFNVIQAVVLAEFDGLRKPNRYGDRPFIDNINVVPNENYFSLVDWTVEKALELKMYMGLLPTWGDKVTPNWGDGPVVFTETTAYNYGLFIGKRYSKYPNIIWILGGDRPPMRDSMDWRPIWRAMAKGIKEGTGGRALFTYHTWGGPLSTSQQIHNEQWLSINTMQSGHGGGHDVPVWEWITRDRKLIPAKPTLDAEPNYEDHPVNPWPKWDSANGYFNSYDVRKQCYRSVFAGACGVTYGHHAVWQFYSAREEKINHADRFWTEAIDRPGAFQVGFLRKLIESRPSLGRIPDNSIILEGQGDKGEKAIAFRDADSTYLMAYFPVAKEFQLSTDGIKSDNIRIWLYNPALGKAISFGTIQNLGTFRGGVTTKGKEQDLVVIVEDASKNFKEPGK